MNREKIISIGAVVLVVGAIVGLAVFGGSKIKKPVASNVPPVATVNGVAIGKDTYDAQLANAITAFKAQGVNTDDATQLSQIKTQVLNDLIANELVNQGIAKAGIKPAQADIDAQFNNIITQVGGNDKFQEQLKASKMTEAQVKANIARQLSVQTYLVQNIDVNSATVTDAEVKKFYDDNTKGQKNAPALKDVAAQIKQQLVNQKQQVLINAFIQKLKEGAKIETTSNL